MSLKSHRHTAFRIVASGIAAVRREAVFFSFILLAFVWPQLTSDLFRIEATHWETLCLYAAYAFAATLPLAVIDGRMRRCYKITVYAIAYSVSIAECFLLVFFRTFFTPSILSVAAHTDPAECLEFIGCYFTTGRFALFFAACGLVIGFNLLMEKIRHTLSMPYAGALTALLAGGGILGLAANAGPFMSAWKLSRIRNRYEFHQLLHREPDICLERRSALGRLFFSLRIESFDRSRIGSLHEATAAAAVDSCTFRSPEIVLILGESYDKHHAALYGYPLPTTPRLLRERSAGRLFPFTDVVSPANLTVSVMQSLFTMASRDQQTIWYDIPLFPALFRRAGYDTLMFDNQTTFALDDDVWDQEIGNFLYHPRLVPLLFTYCNPDRHRFDNELIADFDRQDTLRRNPFRLTIFHLMGQHIAYCERFPAQDRYFTADSIPEYSREGLSRNRPERRIIADYDNATRYNDRVVGEIFDRFRQRDAIVIYLSDHGEEVFDYAHRNGRIHDPTLTADCCRHQYEIPFMIWMSDRYRENHPDIAAAVARSVDRPYMTDDLPHLLLDLAGIGCKWFDPTRSVINERFDTSRPRLLREDKIDYDSIMQHP